MTEKEWPRQGAQPPTPAVGAQMIEVKDVILNPDAPKDDKQHAKEMLAAKVHETLLSNPTASNGDIAMQLGYTDHNGPAIIEAAKNSIEYKNLKELSRKMMVTKLTDPRLFRMLEDIMYGEGEASKDKLMAVQTLGKVHKDLEDTSRTLNIVIDNRRVNFNIVPGDWTRAIADDGEEFYLHKPSMEHVRQERRLHRNCVERGCEQLRYGDHVGATLFGADPEFPDDVKSPPTGG